MEEASPSLGGQHRRVSGSSSTTSSTRIKMHKALYFLLTGAVLILLIWHLVTNTPTSPHLGDALNNLMNLTATAAAAATSSGKKIK